jgi:hypothetical protein
VELLSELTVGLSRAHAPKELGALEPPRAFSQGLEDGDGPPIDRDCDLFPCGDSIEEQPGVVTKLSGSNIAHATIVALMRHALLYLSLAITS